MPPFYIIVLTFTAGAGITFFFVKGSPTLKQRRTVDRLEADKANLKSENVNLEDRNINLAKTLRRLENLEKEVKQIRADVNANTELLTSVTSIRDKVGKDSRIVVSDGFKRKYGMPLESSSQNSSNNDGHI